MTTPSFIEANGLRFAYLEEGEGPLVLLLHGFPDTPRSWDPTRPLLAAEGFRAVSPWTRGYAPTEIPADGPYDADTLGSDAIALIEALGHDDAFVVGHDWGAVASFSAVGLAPERVRKLVTIGVPHPASMLPTPKMIWTMRHFFTLGRKGAADKLRARDLAYIEELVQRWSPSWKIPSAELEPVKQSFEVPGSLEAALGYYRAASPRLTRAQRRRVTVPSVAFAGTDDIISPRAYLRAASRYDAGYEVVQMPGSHFMHREHPEHFNRELLRVLQE